MTVAPALPPVPKSFCSCSAGQIDGCDRPLQPSRCVLSAR
jgi:hypothetical protein